MEGSEETKNGKEERSQIRHNENKIEEKGQDKVSHERLINRSKRQRNKEVI